MLPLAFALLPAGAAAAAQPGPFSTAHVVGNTLYLDSVRCTLEPTSSAFAPDVNVTVRNSYLAPPPLAVHRGACDDGATKIVRVVVSLAPRRAHPHRLLALLDHHNAQHQGLANKPIAVASLPSSSRARSRARARVGGAAMRPAARLRRRRSNSARASSSIRLRGGARRRVGGARRAGAAFALTTRSSRTSSVRLPATVVVHDEPSADDAPNDAPSDGSGTRSRALRRPQRQRPRRDGTLDGVSVALGVERGGSGADHGVWHLLTDCFRRPAASASRRWAPSARRRRAAVRRHGRAARRRRRRRDLARASRGHCADVTAHSDACTGGSAACQANTAVSSDSPTLWRTVAHEIAHNLGAEHTEDRGGLMAYTGEKALVDNGDVCTTIADVRGGADDCFVAATAVCGNGAVEEGEGCDDGGVADGDSRDAACASSAAGRGAPLDPAASGGGHASLCERLCGNGVVDAARSATPGRRAARRLHAARAPRAAAAIARRRRLRPPPTTATCGGSGGCVGGECRMAEPSASGTRSTWPSTRRRALRPPSSRAAALPRAPRRKRRLLLAAPRTSRRDAARYPDGHVRGRTARRALPGRRGGRHLRQRRLEPGEECDDVGVLHGQCRLAAGAACSGECCPAPACAAAPTPTATARARRLLLRRRVRGPTRRSAQRRHRDDARRRRDGARAPRRSARSRTAAAASSSTTPSPPRATAAPTPR